MGTAHPAKFADIIEPIINKKIKFPERLHKVITKEKKSTVINNNYEEFCDYLLTNFK